MRNVSIIVLVVFIATWMGLIMYMPNELYSSGYDYPYPNIPEEFRAYDTLPSETELEKNLNKGSSTIYEFTEEKTAIKVTYDTIYWSDLIVLFYSKTKFIVYIYEEIPLYPPIDKVTLTNNWDSYNNISIVKMTYLVDCKFEDANTSRNDIGLAFEDGNLNCTIYMKAKDSDIIGAKEIVLSLLTFRIPSIYPSIHPLFGYLISVIIYVPIVFATFAIFIKILHGGD